jgi:ribonuclease BN (tRNA processing enzyme)
MKTEFKVYGARGSMAAPKKEYMGYGGNTSSYTLRTPENTLIFLDAGTGIQYAGDELNEKAENVMIAFSHMHADHVMGLGMSALPWLCFNPKYNGKKIDVAGPKGTLDGLKQFYDGKYCWPVNATDDQNLKPNMPAINFSGLEELVESKEYQIDKSTRLTVMEGNHPVQGGVLLYRFELQTDSGKKSLVYATDNEFDYITNGVPNKDVQKLTEAYVEFVRGTDVLVADAQYTEDEYIKQGKFHGFGHSYQEQIIDLAAKADVKQVIIAHHGKNDDKSLGEREKAAIAYAERKGYPLKVQFAKEGMEIVL